MHKNRKINENGIYALYSAMERENEKLAVNKTHNIEDGYLEYENYLTSDEMKICDSIVNKRRKIEFIGGRKLLKECVKRILEKKRYGTIGYRQIDILHNENQRPFLLIEGREMNSIFVSISHSYEYIFCGASEDKRVGLDVERIDRKLIELKKSYTSSDEEKVIEAAAKNEEQLKECFTKLWTAKESIVKYYNLNMFHVFEYTKLIEINGDCLTLKYKDPKSEQILNCQSYVYDNYAFSIVR
ncbi:MAG: 4'-phosphopantetheinyl transferase superfamily protein [Proteobacteria bacterium]|nr:4'-phosphopantetheinyl transferase superfamily protein [Pseudomonadota bacterium]